MSRVCTVCSVVLVLISCRATAARAQAAVYADTGARALVAGVRAAVDRQERSLESYQAMARERLSVTLPGVFREHLVYRREMAA